MTTMLADLPKVISAEPTITIYGPPVCPNCKKAMIAFDRQKVAYTKIDLEDGDVNHVYVKHTLGYDTAPVIIVSFDGFGDVVWGGHRLDMLMGLMKLITTYRATAQAENPQEG